MGMYDSIYCRYPLPGLGVVDDEFQTKDTPSQFLEVYEIREDGTLWHQEYDVVDRSDPEATGLRRICGIMARENQRWVREWHSGTIQFCTSRDGGWIEFEADFVGGKLRQIRACPEGGASSRPRLAFNSQTVEAIRADEREACARIVQERADQAKNEGEIVLELVLRTLTLRVRAGTRPKPDSGVE